MTPESNALTTEDPGKKIVRMDDLKKALEEYEKKHSQIDCNTKAPTVESFSMSSIKDNPSLSDVLRLIKKGAVLQNFTPKPDEGGFSWVKIKVPAV
ncbi:hypothetical protein KGM_200435 [Danaus plexippus plexippus]|uniref:Uncharacterized protein n=1 Tax=Danaus plexippus plexippus TaxID=278856 RepID=A0A212ERB6_DANPL|nr:hypothetical protein KGM_200435 [Danaus plexippus plexippus]